MKKLLTAPLCSALVIPGLGQVINQEPRKGLTLLAMVFILIILAAVKFYLVLSSAAARAAADGLDGTTILDSLKESDLTLLWVLAAVFLAVWAFSVADAFRTAWKNAQAQKGRD